MTEATRDLIVEHKGSAGLITLNRPEALNALTHDMARGIRKALERWIDDDRIRHVLIKGAGSKAFCAGGDLRDLYDTGVVKGRKGSAEQLAFFADEYRLNAYIHAYPKPFVALVDGIVMGGGVGVSMHGRYRVGSEKLMFAMPEVGIGFFPDVGGTYMLPRLKGEAGTFYALTGERVRQAEAFAVGILTHTTPSARFAELEAALIEAHEVKRVLDQFHAAPDTTSVASRLTAIDRLFSAPSVEEILSELDAEAGEQAEFAAKAAAAIRAKSPLSVTLALHQMRIGRDLSFNDAMVMEFRIVNRILCGHDFYEGIRAVIIDKDNHPRWRPASLAGVDPAEVAGHFAPPPSGDLKIR